MKILFFGDIVGRPGRAALAFWLPALRQQHVPDMVLANAENAAGGAGLTPDIAEELFDLGLDGMTLGNHAWAKRELLPYLEHEHRVLRPLNFPGTPPGQGCTVLETRDGTSVGLISLHGRVFFPSHPDDPFSAGLDAARKLRAQGVKVVVVDIHAEATSEKTALGWYLDGEVTAVLGTHTHVQTADQRLLPRGTAYITDLGMTGPTDSVIGVRTELALERFVTQLPVRFAPATGLAQVSGCVLEACAESGRALSIERFILPHTAI